MIKAFFFDLQQISSGASRPAGFEKSLPTKVGVIGAGMMGAGIAYVTAKAGIDVVLLDVSDEAAEKGKDYARGLEEKALKRGKTTPEKSEALLSRIVTSSSDDALSGVDFVIEAVFEDVALKQSVFTRIENAVAPDAVLGSNTSTLPITKLAAAVSRPEDFIGIHFFSPVDKMPLVEIVRGEKTSDAALAKVFDYVLAIRKTPIVVNDSRGFFTSRVIGTFMSEALAMLGEGIAPSSIEQAAVQAGYPVGALQLYDELTLTLSQRIRTETRAGVEAEGGTWVSHPADDVLDWMISQGRTGRKAGAGFYDYNEDGSRGRIWPGLREQYGSDGTVWPLEELQERMLFIESLETVRCFDEGVLTSVADANIGSIYGIGYPAWTGGVMQYIDQYEGGVAGFVARAKQLAEKYGERFTPPASLVERAGAGA
jgi:3-hydroxyacyl-CoA dehydrogenase/enoyl-CoA hydratase/3-hydroxybutyryl-CoA epimerase